MDAKQIIEFIKNSKKKTPVKVFCNVKGDVDFGDAKVFGCAESKVVFGDWEQLKDKLSHPNIVDYVVENDSRNSAIPMLDKKDIKARIEPGAVIRENVHIGDNAVIMMGAIINIGASIGDATMIDMGAILGGRALVGNRCHIGAGTVLAGVIEPPSATPVVIEDDVVIGANAVVIEGVRVGKGSVVAAGAVVIEDVPSGVVVGGVPARILKRKDQVTDSKTEIVDALRQI